MLFISIYLLLCVKIKVKRFSMFFLVANHARSLVVTLHGLSAIKPFTKCLEEYFIKAENIWFLFDFKTLLNRNLPYLLDFVEGSSLHLRW